MAKILKIPKPSRPNPIPVDPDRGGRIPRPSALIERNGALGYIGADSVNPLARDEFGTACCCGGVVPCEYCCKADFDTSGGNCCYSYTAQGKNQNRPDIKINGFVLRDHIKIVRKDIQLDYSDQQMTVIQTGPSDWFTDAAIGCNGGRCAARFPIQYQFRDFLEPNRNYDEDDTMTICLGPRKLCGWTVKRLWEANSGGPLGELLQFADGTCQTFGGWGWPRAYFASDQSSMCDDITEAWSANGGNGGNLVGTRDFQMAFGIVREIEPCRSDCAGCL